MRSEIKIGSKWMFKHSKPQVKVKVYEVYKNSVSYGILSSVSGHVTTTIKGFLENYQKAK